MFILFNRMSGKAKKVDTDVKYDDEKEVVQVQNNCRNEEQLQFISSSYLPTKPIESSLFFVQISYR